MPPATAYWDDLEAVAYRALQQAAEEERRARSAWHDKAWKYYDGDQPKPLRPPKNGSRFDDNVIINVTRQAAEHTLSFAVPSFPTIELESEQDATILPDSPDEDSAEASISDFWKDVGEATWLSNLMLIGILEGHVFVRLMPPDVGDEWPRLIVLNPANVLVYWSADDIETPLWYEITYMAGGQKRKQDLIAPGVAGNAQWQIREYRLQQSHWQLMEATDDYTPVGDWPYENPPLTEWQHLPRPMRYYGDHELNIHLNDAINKVASDIKAILRYHAAPKIFGNFDTSRLTESEIGGFFGLDRPDARAQVLEMQSDLVSSMNFLGYLNGAYFQQSRVTILSGGPDAYKGITNLGIKAAFMSQLAKTETLQRQYGWGIAQLTQAAMEMANVAIEEPVVKWPNSLPISDAENLQVVQGETALGLISKQTATGELGLDWELEQTRIAEQGTPGATQQPRNARPITPDEVAAMGSLYTDLTNRRNGGANGRSTPGA